MSGTSTFRAGILSSQNDANAIFSNLCSSLESTKDSASNAQFTHSAELTQRATQSIVRGFTRLLNFVEGASAQMRTEDVRLSRVMQNMH